MHLNLPSIIRKINRDIFYAVLYKIFAMIWPLLDYLKFGERRNAGLEMIVEVNSCSQPLIVILLFAVGFHCTRISGYYLPISC